jgi:hypothetical protein
MVSNDEPTPTPGQIRGRAEEVEESALQAQDTNRQVGHSVRVEKRLPTVIRIISRAIRWLFYSVVLAFVPIAFSCLFLPAGSPLIAALEHGELVILSAALSAGAFDLLLGVRGANLWKNLMISICVSLIIGSLATLAAVVGKSPQLTPSQLVGVSGWLLGIAIIVGCMAVIADMEGR